MTAPTSQDLAAAYDREWGEMQEHRSAEGLIHRTQTAQAHKMGAVPPDPPLSQVAKYAYVRPAQPTRVKYTGD